MDEPTCCKCGKRYYENVLEVVGDRTRCVSCTDIPRKKQRNLFSRVYYRYQSEYGLSALGNVESMVISKLKV